MLQKKIGFRFVIYLIILNSLLISHTSQAQAIVNVYPQQGNIGEVVNMLLKGEGFETLGELNQVKTNRGDELSVLEMSHISEELIEVQILIPNETQAGSTEISFIFGEDVIIDVPFTIFETTESPTITQFFPQEGMINYEIELILEFNNQLIGDIAGVTMGGFEIPVINHEIVDNFKHVINIYLPPWLASGENEIKFYFENFSFVENFLVLDPQTEPPHTPVPTATLQPTPTSTPFATMLASESIYIPVTSGEKISFNENMTHIFRDYIKNLEPGKAVISYPETMTAGKKYTAILRISVPSSEDIEPTIEVNLSKNLPTGNLAETFETDTDAKMFAVLEGDGDNFKINTLSPDEQYIFPDQVTEWVWEVTPQKSGSQSLIFTLGVIIDLKDLPSEIHEITEVKEVNVKVNPGFAIGNFLNKNWQWVASTLLIPLGGYLYKLYKDHKENKVVN